MVSFRNDRKRNDVKVDACVTCRTCACEIALATPRLPAEFSVSCPDCRRRGVYGSAEVHERREEAAAIRTPGKAGFSKRKRTETEMSPEMDTSIRAGSWLGDCATWLMQ